MSDPDILWSPESLWRRIEAGESVFAGLTKFQISVLLDECLSDIQHRNFLNTPMPEWIRASGLNLQGRKRQRGWWAGLAIHGNNPFGPSEIDDELIAVRRKQCNRLTKGSRLLGAQRIAAAARLIRIRLLDEHGESIRALGSRGVSTLAKELSPAFGLAASTLRAHITAVRKDLMTSR